MNQELKELLFRLQTFVAREYPKALALNQKGDWHSKAVLASLENVIDNWVYDEDGLDTTMIEFEEMWRNENEA